MSNRKKPKKISGDYNVGHGKTPKHTRWKKGQSGNPKGRPKGSRNMSTIMKEVLERPVIIRENGKERCVSYREAFIHKLAASGLEGPPRDMIQVMRAINDFFPEAMEPEKQVTSIAVHFVRSDGNGRPAPTELEEWEKRNASRPDKTNKTAPSQNRDSEGGRDSDDPTREAAWRASGIDDESE